MNSLDRLDRSRDIRCTVNSISFCIAFVLEKRKKRFPSITYSFPDAESLALSVLLIKNRFFEEVSRSSPINILI